MDFNILYNSYNVVISIYRIFRIINSSDVVIFRRALVPGLVIITGTAIEPAPSVGPQSRKLNSCII